MAHGFNLRSEFLMVISVALAGLIVYVLSVPDSPNGSFPK